MKFIQIIFILLLSSLTPIMEAHAAVLSNETLYYRCYERITGLRVPDDDPILPSIRSGAADAIATCLAHLDKASLNTNGNTKITESDIGTKVLGHMHLIHSSFMQRRGFNVPNLNDNQKAINYDLLDPTAPALFYTRALFKSGTRADSIITGKENLVPVRVDNDPASSVVTGYAKSTYAYSKFAGNGFSLTPNGPLKGLISAGTKQFEYYPIEYLTPPDPLPAQTGEQLYASKCASCHGAGPTSTKRNRALATLTKALSSQANMKTLGVTAAEANLITMYLQDTKTLNYGESQGAGFIGTHVYFMKTVDQEDVFRSNLAAMPRRWVTSVFSDALCRDLPLIRIEDGESFAVPTSNLPFRTSRTCTQCHASMDRVGSTLRNFQYKRIPMNLGNNRSAILYEMAPVTLASESGWPSEADYSYHERPPKGTLYYRTASTGDLVDLSVNNVEDLGLRLAEQDDFYICLANKYWHYLTNKGVKMNDKKTMDGYSAVEKARFDKIKAWGLALKARSDQSVRWMLEQMLKSAEFADSAFGP